jgi:hypothetical protein
MSVQQCEALRCCSQPFIPRPDRSSMHTVGYRQVEFHVTTAEIKRHVLTVGLSADSGPSSASVNSRCIRSIMVASACVDLSRSALPNRTPLTDQFAPKRALGDSGWTITPTKDSQPGSDFFTASVIADCKRSSETELRSSSGPPFRSQAKM